MKIDEVNAKDLKQLREIVDKLVDIGRYLNSCNLNECEAAREAYEKLADVQIFLMESYFTLGLNKATNDIKKCLEIFTHYETRD
ncbi:MAG: hypothetical protein SPE00_00240 [Bacilli bacterium]|nr:hypothetical protein [Bacilli bacterium]